MPGDKKCPVCSGARLTMRFMEKYGYAVNKANKTFEYGFIVCDTCGLGYVDPIPDNDVLASLYREDYPNYSLVFDPKVEANSLKYKIAAYRYTLYQLKSIVNFIKTFSAASMEMVSGRTVTFSLGIPLSLSKNSRILDVGYGTGSWLLAMKEAGFQNMSGYDIDDNAMFKTKLSEANIQLYAGDFINTHFNDRFDCIRMEHVFEHLPNPHEMLAKCFELLNPGGSLVMTYPGMNSICRMISLKNANDLDVPRHIFHHSKRSSKTIIEAAGFHLIKIKELGISSGFYLTMKNILHNYRGLNRALRFVILNPLFQWLYFIVCLVTKKGEFISVYCKKPALE